MDATTRTEQALTEALAHAEGQGCPPRLAEAMRHAVFPGGARIRPGLCLAVGAACGEDRPELTAAAGASIELLHCASLVHDDLPCFDDASLRRGRPSVHSAFGEPLAVLTGDALIVLAFESLALRAQVEPLRLAPLTLTIAAAAGAPVGIVAGQAWECEPKVELSDYHRAKTGALFVAATVAGAQAAGADAEPWRLVGDRLGEAYQVADDIRDAAASTEELGKPAGRDADLGRPSAVRELGLEGAVKRLRGLIAESLDLIPAATGAGAGTEDLVALIKAYERRILPDKLAEIAA